MKKRNNWILSLIFGVCYCSMIKGLELNPNVRSLYVIKGTYQEIDCFENINGDTIDIKWTGPPEASYNVADRKSPNSDGSSTFHHILKLPSFSQEDVGTYTCTYTISTSKTEQTQIKLYLQDDCQFGKFGKNCDKDCSKDCKSKDGVPESPCNPVDGACKFGCNSGYLGTHCDVECPNGKYGTNCSQQCNKNCLSDSLSMTSPCNPSDGSCRFGCKIGYSGDLCTDRCGVGKYGSNCKKNCSKNCMPSKTKHESSCSPVDGSCIHGCITGYQGTFCDTESSAEQLSTGVIAGIVIGILVLAIIITVIVYCILKRRKGKGDLNLKTDAESSGGVRKSLLARNSGREGHDDQTCNIAERDKMSNELNALLEFLKGLTDNEEELKDKVDKYKEEKEALIAREKKLKEQVEALEKQLEAAEGREQKLEDVNRQLFQVQGAVAHAATEKKEELKLVQKKLHKKQWEMDNLQREKDQATELVTELKDEVRKMAGRIHDLEAEVTKIKAELKYKTQEAECYKEGFEVYRKKNEKLSEQLAAAERQLEEFKKENEIMKRELGFEDIHELKRDRGHSSDEIEAMAKPGTPQQHTDNSGPDVSQDSMDHVKIKSQPSVGAPGAHYYKVDI